MDTLLSLILFAAVATLSPGGATTLATACGIQFGYLRSLPLVAGIACGLATLVASASVGLGAMLLAVPALSLAMKIVGTVYLLWLAWKIARSGSPGKTAVDDVSPIGFVGGYLLLLINPKAWAMAFGASASFSNVADNPVELAVIMGSVFVVAASLSLSLWSAGGALLASIVRTDFQWRALNIFLAGLLTLSILPFWFG